MEDLKRLDKLVEKILKEDDKARNNLFYLYYLVAKERNPSIVNARFSTVLLNPKEYNLKSFESVSRCRRKIVENHPELAGNEEVEGGRWSNEEKFREYARECV